MTNKTIPELPFASPLVGTEQVPIQQNGLTVQTTVSAIANSPTQQQTFITVNQEPTLANSRSLIGGLGIGLTTGVPQGQVSLYLNGVSASLENASQGIVVKNSGSGVTNRSIAITGAGLSISNANGVSGNPTIGLSGLPSLLASLGGTGLLTVASGSTLGTATITGTANQINVVGGDGSSTPTISIADNPIFSGTGSITLPNGTTGQRLGSLGAIRYNVSLNTFEGYTASGWQQFSYTTNATTFRTTLSGLTPSTVTSGDIVLGGTLGISSGGTGQVTASASFNALSPITTTGDLIIGNGTNSATRLPIGSNGYVLTSNGVTAIWQQFSAGSGTVTSVGATGGTGISVSGSPITTSGSFTVTNTAPDQVVTITGGGSTTVTGTYPNFTVSSTGGGSVAGSDTQVQFNNSGSFGANANFTYTGTDVNIPFGTSNSATSSAKIALALSMIG